MTNPFAELRAAREAQGISLEQIAQKTMISIDVLRALESGNTSGLPAAYVRAFLREYAERVGLDPNALVQQYAPADGSPPPAAPPVQEEQPPVEPAPPPRQRVPWWKHRALRAALVTIAAILLILVISYLDNISAPPRVQELPFGTSVRENERRLAPVDSVPAGGRVMVESPKDSLILKAFTTDSVWVQVVVDGLPPVDYLFPPNASRQWKARDRFALTLGNAGGIRFRLNTRDIGALGKPGSVVRNVELTRQTLSSPPSAGPTP
jgi:cytoskeleton protein RodZ